MAELCETNCCGIRELNDVSGAPAKGTIEDAAREWFENDMDGAYIFFSVTQNYLKTGRNLTDYIKRHGLGSVFKTIATHNPNSGNMLHMYVWTVHKDNFKKFYTKFVKDQEDDEDEEDW